MSDRDRHPTLVHAIPALLLVLIVGLVAALAVVRPLGRSPSSGAAALREEGEGGSAGERTSGAMEALDLWARSRAYPAKLFPETGFVEAFDYSRANLAEDPALRSTVDPWTAIGPHNIGGRTLAVAQNPLNRATLWAGAASGGLWRSFTAGVGPDAWDPVDTGFPVLAVSSIAIAPGDSNLMYIGTGEVYAYQNSIGGLAVRLTRGSYGIGILKSTNGGTSWAKVLDWSYNQRRGVASLAMNPTNPSVIYAGTTEGTYKTTDGGTSWNVVQGVLMAMQVVLDPADPERVYVACGDHGSPGTGIYRSTNGGASWTQLTAGLPGSWTGKVWLDIWRASPNVIYASVANAEAGIGTYYSTNYGDSWVRLSTNNYHGVQGFYSHFVNVDPTDSSIVLTAGVDIWRSTNGGRTQARVSVWSNWFFGDVPPGGPEGPANYSHADHHYVMRDPQRPDTLYFGNDGGVFRSFDNGLTFAGANGGYQSTQFYNGFSSAILDVNLAIGGMQDNATAIYHGVVGWRRVIGGDGCWTAMHPLNLSTMYGESQFLNIQRSTNGGANWSTVTSGIGSETAAFVAPFLLSQGIPATMYAGTTKIYRSTNSATSWSATNGGAALNGDPTLSMAISNISPDVVYAGTAPVIARSGVFLTTNAGASWTNITGTLPDRYPVDLAVDPVDDSIAYVVCSGFGSGHLFRTTNRGGSWADITGTLPDVPSSAVAVDPDYPGILYFGNDLGVYLSTDTGATWQEFREGMPAAAIVMDLSVVRLDRHLRAVTHGYGVFERPMFDPSAAVAEGGGRAPAAAVVRVLGSAPNPFAESARVSYALGARAAVEVKLVDASGRVVATLERGERVAGEHAVRVDARRLGLASGVYFVRVEAGGRTASHRLVVAR